MNNYIDSNKQEHGVLGYEVSATQHVIPFIRDKGWFLQGFGNKYTISKYKVAIRHYYSISNRARWLCIDKYRTDNHYRVEVYNSVELDGEFYNRTVYMGTAYTLRDAIHLANSHKSDK